MTLDVGDLLISNNDNEGFVGYILKIKWGEVQIKWVSNHKIVTYTESYHSVRENIEDGEYTLLKSGRSTLS